MGKGTGAFFVGVGRGSASWLSSSAYPAIDVFKRSQITAPLVEYPHPPAVEGEREYRADQFPRTEQIVGGHLTSELVPQRSYLASFYNESPRTYVPRRDELANPSTSRYSFASVVPAYR